MGTTSYAIALGSNRRHGRHGDPRGVVEAAMIAMADAGLTVTARSAIRETAAMGGAGRRFANAAVMVGTTLTPSELLVLLKRIEREFGRRPARRWGPRVLDLDILLQFPGAGAPRKILLCGNPLGRRPVTRTERLDPGVRRGTLTIPHTGMTARAFVLEPLLDIAPKGRHPVLGLSFASLLARLRRATPVDRSGRRL